MADIGPILAHLDPILAPSWPHFGTIFTHVDPKKEDKLNNCSKQIHSKIGSPKRRLAHILFFSKSLWRRVGTKMLAPIPTPAQPKPTQANSNPSQVSPRPLPKNAHVVKFSNVELQKNPISFQDHVSPILAKPNPVVPTNLHQPLHTFSINSSVTSVLWGPYFLPILLEQGFEAAVYQDVQLFKRSEDSKK